MRPLLSLLSPAGARGRLSVLIFHRVHAVADPLFPDEVDAARFDAICRWLATWFQVLPLPAAAQALAEGRLPARAACITFDDGYADNHDIALPILQRHRLTATFFIATGFLDGGVMWNDRIIEALRAAPAPALDLAACGLPSLGVLPLQTTAQRRAAIDAALGAAKYLTLPQRLDVAARLAALAGTGAPPSPMMSTAQVRAMHAAGMTIGAHTVHHPILATLDGAAARQEISASKARLEDITQARVSVFAYPNGRPVRDYVGDSVQAVREAGFDAAVTTAAGAAARGCDLLQIPRFTPWDRGRTAFGLRLARTLASRGSGLTV